MKIVIPTKEEVRLMEENEEAQQEGVGALPVEKNTGSSYVQYSTSQSITKSDSAGNEESGKVDLNTADENTLCTLPGIGPSRAKSIIDYRDKNGKFKKIEDVMQVSGIKEAAFEKIKDRIMVSN